VLTFMDIVDGFAVLVNTLSSAPIFHIHICADEVQAFSNAMPVLSNAMPSLGNFLQRATFWLFSRHNHNHCSHHVGGSTTDDDSCPN
jgi:hypothetical protein